MNSPTMRSINPFETSRMAGILPRLRALFVLALVGASVSGCGYNTIPTLEEQAKARWADVQNQYQRRADLIPNLVATVQGYAKQEREVLTSVIEARAKARWADVQNQYQRRADLIPNLVATVQGYAKQEREVLTSVIEARAKATSVRIDASQLTDPEKIKQFQDAQAQLSGALGRLLAVSENYPDLKSNQNFLALQSQLEGTENRIAVARRDYIEAVRAYNLSLKTFPTLLWAVTLFRGNKPMAEFTASEAAQTPPQVKF